MTTPMDRDWAVTTAAERATTDEQGRAEMTFTVTNIRDAPARAALTVTADADEARSWFTVTDPVRTIDAGASSPFVVKIRVPPSASAATYAFQASVHTADAAPDASSTPSNRVLLDVTPRPAAKRRPLPGSKILVFAVGGGLAVVLVVIAVLVVVLVAPSDPPPATVSPSAALPTDLNLIPVPDVVGNTDIEAISRQISERGLVPVIKYRFDPLGGRSSSQHPAPDDRARAGDLVVVTFDIPVSAPTALEVSSRIQPQRFTLPYGDNPPRHRILDVDLSWDQAETFVTTWQVMFFSSICYVEQDETVVSMGVLATGVEITHVRHVSVNRVDTPRPSLPYVANNCGSNEDLVYVAAVDDFGNLGPLSDPQIVQP